MAKVKVEKVLAIASRVGLTIVEQPSQYKIYAGEDTSRRMYVPGRKEVHKVELSGWNHELAVPWESQFPGKKAPSPKITHVVNFNQDERLVLNDLYRIMASLAGASAPAEPAPEPAPAEEPVAQVA